jgi:hypothetical protein
VNNHRTIVTSTAMVVINTIWLVSQPDLGHTDGSVRRSVGDFLDQGLAFRTRALLQNGGGFMVEVDIATAGRTEHLVIGILHLRDTHSVITTIRAGNRQAKIDGKS